MNQAIKTSVLFSVARLWTSWADERRVLQFFLLEIGPGYCVGRPDGALQPDPKGSFIQGDRARD